MTKSKRIPGIDTIQGLVGTPPMVITISHKVIAVGDSVRQLWNSVYIAFIPYCFVCHIPLDWHLPSDNGKVFTCPSCNRRWVLGE